MTPALPPSPTGDTNAAPADTEVAGSGAAAASTSRWQRHMARHMDRAPEWFCAFLAGSSREKNRFKRDMATIRGSVVWLARQRRQGHWTAHEREHLRQVMRTASSVSPYLLIWVVPGSLVLLPFLAWFIDHRRKGRTPPDLP